MSFQERLEQIRKARKDMDCEFTTTNYRKYRRNGNNQLPTLKYIYKRYIWPEFIKLLDGKKQKKGKILNI